jgi:nucleoside-diphosphate-sugar epimerase
MEKILVTGGAGFIGSNLVESLLKEGKQLVLFDSGFRVGFNNIQNIKDNVEIIKGDIRNYEDWKKIPNDCDFVFHLAAINGTKYFYEIPHKVLDVNVNGVLNFVKWIENSNVKRFFFASSSEVYGFPKNFPTNELEPLMIPESKNPRFSYSSSKIIGETISINFAKELGIDYTIGRFHNVYGPSMGFEHVMPEFIKKCVLNKTFTVQGNGKESRSFCYISDAINAIKLISQHINGRNEIFNIGTNEEVSINQLIEVLEDIHESKLKIKYVDFENEGTRRRIPDISKITELGYRQNIPLNEGLRLTYNWYKEYYLKNQSKD